MRNFKPNLQEDIANRCKQLNPAKKEEHVITIHDYTKQ